MAVSEENKSNTESQITLGPIAGGRSLPELLFVTSRQALIANIGQAETTVLLQALQEQGLLVYDALPQGASVAAAINLVRQQMQSNSGLQGIVLIGGYDVMPAQRLDVLDIDLRRALPPTSDPDNFIVWSDDGYGDLDGDGLPELPVSRIPDGKSAQLVFTALQASNRSVGTQRGGLRNIYRPFVDEIYTGLPGTEPVLTSENTVFNQTPPYTLMADHVYLLLHGSAFDGSGFWGEASSGGQVEAMHISNVPSQCGRVVFTGCCWGALMVDTKAVDATPDRHIVARTTQSSIALNFLANGATAFVGCTGSHYSPIDTPYHYYGAPLHAAFWSRYLAGSAPAKALFEAKYTDYIKGIPHHTDDVLSRAIEHKILGEYTCLGLGW